MRKFFKKKNVRGLNLPKDLKKLKREPIGLKAKTLGTGKANKRKTDARKKMFKAKNTRTPNGGASVLLFIPFLLTTNLNF